jgi:PPOX class probable F420-dependent enzyme
MPATLPDKARTWLDGREFATVATIEPDGQPQLSVIWVKTDGDDILFSTVRGRRKYTNLVREPRATLLVYPADEPYSYVEIRGTVTITDEGGPELIQELSHKYVGKPYTNDTPGTERVVVRIHPVKVVFRG